MLFKLVTAHRFLALVLVAASAAFAACSAEVTPLTSGGDGTTPPPGSTSDPAPTPTTTSTTETPPPPAKDGGADPASVKVTLQVTAAGYENTTAAGGGYVYAIDFDLENTSSKDVTSIDTMTFDLGGANQVTLTKPVCQGKFPIPAGDTKTIETQVVISTSGSVSNFSFICPGSQVFGGASGKAPATASFADPIAVTVGGKTSGGGTFSAAGSATRTN